MLFCSITKSKIVSQVFITIILLAASSLSEAADSEACHEDMVTYCSGVTQGSKIAIVNCLWAHETEISDACWDNISGQKERNQAILKACKTDQRTFCPFIQPKTGQEALFDCLRYYSDDLSDACYDALANQFTQ